MWCYALSQGRTSTAQIVQLSRLRRLQALGLFQNGACEAHTSPSKRDATAANNATVQLGGTTSYFLNVTTRLMPAH